MTAISKVAAAAQRERVIAELKADPSRSDRVIAKLAGSSNTTVFRIRQELMGVNPVTQTTAGEWDTDQQPVGPEEHQVARRSMGLGRVDDLLALARDTDPFYYGTPRDWRLAGWFAGLWERHGGPGAHVRRVHYRATQTEGELKIDGTPYLDKDKQGWADLCAGSQAARILGLVDPEELVDKRTDPVSLQVFARTDPFQDPTAEVDWSHLKVPDIALPEPSFDLPGVTVAGYDYEPADQPVLLEIWVEKSTVDDVLVPICRAEHVNLKVGKGYESITAAVALLRRAEEMGHRRVHVFYVADLDRNGRFMPVVLARHCQFWAMKKGIDVHVTVERLALTEEQVSEYNLPKAPDSEDTELDALEALHPGLLARLVRAAIRPWRDDELEDRLTEEQEAAQGQAAEEWKDATEELAAEAEELRTEAEQIIAEIRPAIDAANLRLADIQGRAADLDERVDEAKDGFGFGELPERPEAEEPDVDTSGSLYDSSRTWLEQLEYWRGNGTEEREAS